LQLLAAHKAYIFNHITKIALAFSCSEAYHVFAGFPVLGIPANKAFFNIIYKMVVNGVI